ncbi:MAG: YceI family protein [Saprospiraceae bacterium]|nr:YceI family protein [Saprospiraceae bacterium]MCF8252678.1 YceI family protein [Saprospiraceae bacterium]MCF8282877.1 YceI family protein [Bacteroidales bacterium]MCF8314250.1 YceI family protein [Saprospiraceae bacterium]MCF8443066.1 YceI family protein [Saprospiraceae bacterium]
MKSLFFVFIAMTVGLHLSGQDNFKLAKSNVEMAGTSTLHEWTAVVTKVSGNGQLVLANNALNSIKSLDIIMATNSINGSEGAMMDKKMLKALKEKEYPSMTFSLTKVNSITQKAGEYLLETLGNLTIAGATRSIPLNVSSRLNGNEITFNGTIKVKMTDYKVAPPVMFLGAVKTDENVTISFEATFVKECQH